MKRFSFKACSVLLCLAMLFAMIIVPTTAAEASDIIGYSDELVGDAFRYDTVNKGSTRAVNVDALSPVKDWNGNWPQTDTSFKVVDVQDLVVLSQIVNSGAHSCNGFNFYLANDIDFAAPENVEWAKQFVPIGYMSGSSVVEGDTTYAKEMYFNGTFDGRGYTIKNMNLTFEDKQQITSTSFTCAKVNNVLQAPVEKTQKYQIVKVGLFGNVKGNINGWVSEIRNVKMENCHVNSTATTDVAGTAGYGSAALLVAYCTSGGAASYSSVQILNCSVDGSVTALANTQAAGIIARGNAVVSNCTNYANIAAKNRQGGINGWSAASITNCVNYGIIGYATHGPAGSIAGQPDGAVTKCHNFGYAHQSGEFKGIVGSGNNVVDCYEAGLKRMLENTKFQINAEGTGVRMLAGLDSLNYESVTFMVTYNGQTVELTTKSAYTSVAGTDAEGNPITYAPNTVGNTTAAKYIAAYDLLNVPAGETFTFVVKVVTSDGITLTSTGTKTVEVPAAQ